MTQIEWQASQTGACLIPLQNRSLIEISGPERGSFLQGIFSQDTAKNFPVGTVKYGIFPTVKGKIFADAYVYHLDQNRFVVDVERFVVEKLIKHLEQFLIMTKAEVKWIGGFARFSLFGPAATTLLPTVPAENQCEMRDEIITAVVARNGLKEIQLWVDSQKAADFANRLQQQAGAILGNAELYDLIQIESQIPKLGRDMDETTYPQEVGLLEALDFQKGCFLGAEVLQHIHYRGRVNRTLALFSLDAESPVPAGIPIQKNGEEIGKVTASAFSYRWNKPVALALVKIVALDTPGAFTLSSEADAIPLALLPTPELLKK